ncbi:MAG TPA: GNAT family N-acetyltransferase, partial [Acidimicrobiales bacterium]|nr:GNAT family N-acetyltransferase [Acidimicrobiales bacterium]
MSTGDYPAEWEADVVLTDGGTVHVRPVRPTDAERLVAFHGRLSHQSVYYRFFSPRPRLSRDDVTRFTTVDYDDRMALVALLGDDLIGIASYDRWPARSEAEVAFTVDDEHQGRGVATVLLEHLAVIARTHGITRFTAEVLPENRKMLSVFKRAGFAAKSQFADGVVEVEMGILETDAALEAMHEREHVAEARSVARLLAPRTIAVIGAGARRGTVGHETLRNLIAHGFTGPVYPVHPTARSVASVRAWPTVLDVPD